MNKTEYKNPKLSEITPEYLKLQKVPIKLTVRQIELAVASLFLSNNYAINFPLAINKGVEVILIKNLPIKINAKIWNLIANNIDRHPTMAIKAAAITKTPGLCLSHNFPMKRFIKIKITKEIMYIKLK